MTEAFGFPNIISLAMRTKFSEQIFLIHDMNSPNRGLI